MIRALGAVLIMMTVAGAARGQEPARPHAVGAATPGDTGAALANAAAASAEERAFAAELERFARLRAFTQQLVAKREAEAFEQATLRQARIAQLQRELSEREAAMSEKEFDEAVALYLRKRELTRELAAARAKAQKLP